MSPSTVTKILHGLTTGEIKSLAGLDNIDVSKGRENFEHMRELAEILGGVIGSDDAKSLVDRLKERIDESETFHKVQFEKHLGEGNSEKNCKCQCMKCGLSDEKIDPIQCKSKDSHTPPCQDCQHAFKIVADLIHLHKHAEVQAKKKYKEIPSLEDDMDSWLNELEVCFQNLIDYRAHLMHKKSEQLFDDEFYKTISDDEAIIICDWKMKILASKYRESQAEWFSKRGSSLLGFEVHLKGEDGKKKVLYHFFLSDDTTQDTEQVLCAKHFLYSEVLPVYGIKKVCFRSDGAMCFSSKEAKATMPIWAALAKRKKNGVSAYETSYKVSVAGCGKTALDVSFTFICFPLANRPR